MYEFKLKAIRDKGDIMTDSLDYNHFCIRPNESSEFIQIKLPAFAFLCLPQIDFYSERGWEGIELLICGVLDDDMITRIQQGK